MARVHSPPEACGSQGGRSSCRGPTVRPLGARQQPCVSSSPCVDPGALCGPRPSVCARGRCPPGGAGASGGGVPLGVLGWFWSLNVGRGESRRGGPGLSRCVGEVGRLPDAASCPPVSIPPRSCRVLRSLMLGCSDCQPAHASHTSSKCPLCAGRGPPRAGCYEPGLQWGCRGHRLALPCSLGPGVGVGIFWVLWGHTSDGGPWARWPEDSGGSGW